MMMDPVDMLIDAAVQHEVLANRNPYLTKETMILRLYTKITNRTLVSPQHQQAEKTALFSEWHDEILQLYEKLKGGMSHDERANVERVLSKDCPHPSELTKFACCWYKYDPWNACRLFAVDGIVGSHPKLYVHDAFSANFARHNAAVRDLYAYFDDPAVIGSVVERAQGDGPLSDSAEDECARLYAELVGEEEMRRVAADRRSSRLKSQQSTSKRQKRKADKDPTPAEDRLGSVPASSPE